MKKSKKAEISKKINSRKVGEQDDTLASFSDKNMFSLHGWLRVDPKEINAKTLPAPLSERINRWDTLGETRELNGISWKPILLKEVELYGSGIFFHRAGKDFVRNISVRVPPRKRLPKVPVSPDPSAAIEFVKTHRILSGDLDDPPTPKPQLIWFDPSIVLGETGPVVLGWRFNFYGDRPHDLIVSLDGTKVLAAIALDLENPYSYTTTPRFLLDPITGVPRFVSFVPPLVLPQTASGSPLAVSEAFFDNFPAMFGTGDPSQQLQIKRIESDMDSGHHVIFQQMYAGLLVWGCELGVHLNDQLAITSISGRYYRDPEIDLTVTFSEQMANSLAISHWQSTNGGDTLGPGQNIEQRGLVVLPWRLADPKGWNSLAWWFRFPDADRFISAQNGRLIVAISRKLSIRKIFDQGGRVLGNNPELQLEDGVQRTSNALDQEALDADAATAAIEGFWRIFGRNGWNGGGADSLVYVETDFDKPSTPAVIEENAMWYDSKTSFSRNWAEPDVIGHEFTHAITEKTAGLNYVLESGALNESFSDVFGKLIFRTPQPWIIGQATMSRDLQNGTFRSPPNPTTGLIVNMPINYANFVIRPVTEEGDWGGVHRNSGIGNRAAVLVADGDGTGAHPGLGRERLARIWWDTLTTRLSPWSSYVDLVANAWQVTRELADGARRGVQIPGSTTQAPIFISNDPNEVLWAFQSVGLDLQLLTGWFRVPSNKTTSYRFFEGLTTSAGQLVTDVIVRLSQRQGAVGTRFLGILQVSTNNTTATFSGGLVTASIDSHGVNTTSRQVDVTVTTKNFADLDVSCEIIAPAPAGGVPPTLPFPTPRVSHWFDNFWGEGRRYGDIIFEMADLMPGCTVSDVELELLDSNGSVIAGGRTRFGQPPAVQGGRGAWIFARSVGGTMIEVRVRSWHDFGTIVRYRLVYWITGLNCGLPNFTIREVYPYTNL